MSLPLFKKDIFMNKFVISAFLFFGAAHYEIMFCMEEGFVFKGVRDVYRLRPDLNPLVKDSVDKYEEKMIQVYECLKDLHKADIANLKNQLNQPRYSDEDRRDKMLCMQKRMDNCDDLIRLCEPNFI